ncbi:MAG: hypothetical protein JOY64_26145 [Alphaproteobacteria bacterium]|nr:hypothetical protein [Alphaproteobacteria bacterium]MBV8411136.1 hypothetical protein [Alphaproteobacteria bacterium]
MSLSDITDPVGLEQLVKRHQDLLKENLAHPLPREQCEEFLRQLAAAGRDVPPGRDRDALRKIFYFWTADAIGKGILGRNQPPPSLAPYAGGGATNLGAATSMLAAPLSPDDVAATARARSVIRIAALARQWQTDNRSAGYLLTGSALEEARSYKDDDPEIRALIDASDAAEASARAAEASAKATEALEKSRRWKRSFITVGLFAVLLAVLAWRLYEVNRELSNTNADLKRLTEDLKVTNDRLAILRYRESQQTRDEARRAVEALNSGGDDPLKPLKGLLQHLGDAQPQELSRLRLAPARGPTGVTSSENTVAAIAVPQDVVRPAPTEGSTCQGVLWLGSETERTITNSGPLADLKPGDKITLRDNAFVRLRKSMPLSGYVMAPQIGLVPGGASLVLDGKPEAHKSSGSATDQYFASVTAPRQYCTRVFVQYAGSANQVDAVEKRLLALSFQVPPPQQVASAAKTAEVRVFWQEDLPMAKLVADSLGAFNGNKPLQVRELFDFASKPSPGSIEVWIDLNGH